MGDGRTRGEEPVIRISGLTKVYHDGTVANRDIDLTIDRGCIFSLAGPNGAGKTTLVRQLTTELLPTEGSISVLGIDIVKSPQVIRQRIGVIPQEVNLFHLLTVEQHLEIFARLKGIPKQEVKRRTDRLLNQLELVPYRRVRIMKLSGGLKRRVLVGLALLSEPEVLILDEPTAGLDPASRRQFWHYIRKEKQRGTTVILTTHSMEEVEYLSDVAAIIMAGEIKAVGSLRELYLQVENTFKLVYQPHDAAIQPRTFYMNSFGEVLQHVRENGIDEYSVTRASFEDVYLKLIGFRIPGEYGDG